MKHKALLILPCLLLTATTLAQRPTENPNPDFKVIVNAGREPVGDGPFATGLQYSYAILTVIVGKECSVVIGTVITTAYNILQSVVVVFVCIIFVVSGTECIIVRSTP